MSQTNDQKRVLIGNYPATSGTAAEMAADSAAIILAGTEAANQGKRWENTTDGLVYDFRPVGGTWGYYPETNADAGGNIPIAVRHAATEIQAHNREKLSVTGVREKVVYAESQNVLAVRFTVLHAIAAAPDSDAALAVCFDAYNDAEADQWLTETDLEAFDTQRYIIQLGESPLIYTFAEPVSRIDFKAIGAVPETLRVFIGGA